MPLRPGVLDVMWDIFRKKNFENTIPVFYKDQLGLRSIGVGVLLDRKGRDGTSPTNPGQQAENLREVLKKSFVKADTGEPAPKEDIIKDWDDAAKIRQATDPKTGDKIPTRLSRPRVMLAESEIRTLFDKMNQQHLDILSQRSWGTALQFRWPADAQLGIMAIAYSAPAHLDRGKAFGKVPQWCSVGRFDKAAQACLEAEWKRGPERKKFFGLCFKAAHEVRTKNMGDGVLYIRILMGI